MDFERAEFESNKLEHDGCRHIVFERKEFENKAPENRKVECKVSKEIGYKFECKEFKGKDFVSNDQKNASTCELK